jgi:adenylosuccinate synthase
MTNGFEPTGRAWRSARTTVQVSLVQQRGAENLPSEARDYLSFIAEFVGVPVRLVGVGLEREQVVWLKE